MNLAGSRGKIDRIKLWVDLSGVYHGNQNSIKKNESHNCKICNNLSNMSQIMCQSDARIIRVRKTGLFAESFPKNYLCDTLPHMSLLKQFRV